MKRAKTTSAKCANPLFLKWLTEWRDEAHVKGSSVENHFTKAIESLQKYPLHLATGRDCILLQHFGVKLCAMLDKKLKKYLDSKQEAHNSDTERGDTCDDVESYVLPKKSRSMEESSLNEMLEPTKKNNFVPKQKTNFAAQRGKNKQKAGKTKENAADFQEFAVLAISVSPEANNSKAKPNKIQRRSKDHSMSSSDSNDDNDRPIVETIDVINNKKSSPKQPLSPVASVDNRVKEKSKVIKKSQTKKRVQDSEPAETETLAKTVEGTDQFHMLPGTFDVILLVDTHETSGGKTKSKDDPTISELDKLKTPYEIRHLKVGDFSWIARCRETNRELVLPYTVERKRMDDLASSIKDGRFHEQKFRLRQSGIPNIIYMVESHGKNQHLGMPLPTLLQAATNSLVQDGFTVKYTDSQKHSMQYLSILTMLIHRIFKEKHLTSSSKENLGTHCILSTKIPLMEFKQFNKAASKVKMFKVREMFVRQLLQLKGLSLDKALAIVELYPTPTILAEAFRNADKAGEKLLAGIKVGNLKRQLGPALSKTVFDLYTKRSLD